MIELLIFKEILGIFHYYREGLDGILDHCLILMVEVANQELKQVGPYVEAPFYNQSRHYATYSLSHVILRVMKRY